MVLQNLRQQIDKVDQKLLALLNDRASIVKEIGQIKKENHSPVYDAKREMEILQNIKKNNRGPMGVDSIENIFKIIILECRKMQTEFLMSEEED